MSRFVSRFCNPVGTIQPHSRNGKKEKRGIATTPYVKRVGNRSAEGCKRRIRAHYEAKQSSRAVFQEPERPTPVCPPLIRTTIIKKNPFNHPLRPLFSPTNRIKVTKRVKIFGLVVPPSMILEFIVAPAEYRVWILRKFPGDPGKKRFSPRQELSAQPPVSRWPYPS